MQSKSLLIAIAAFAVTATGVYAYGGSNVMARAGLNKEQISAIEEARERRAMGDMNGARDTLAAAGITEDELHSVHRAMSAFHRAIHDAVENDDYDAFKVAIADSPLADIITSKADFEQFKEAHDLRMSGDHEGARTIMDDLGVEPAGDGFRRHEPPFIAELTDEQREALQVARQANDRATIQAIFDEAGLEHPQQQHRHARW